MADNKIVEFKHIPASTTVLTNNFLITTMRNGFELNRDDHNANVSHIHACLIEHFGGNWTVLMSPKDYKGCFLKFNAAVVNG